jgi:hypothetical protein
MHAHGGSVYIPYCGEGGCHRVDDAACAVTCRGGGLENVAPSTAPMSPRHRRGGGKESGPEHCASLDMCCTGFPSSHCRQGKGKRSGLERVHGFGVAISGEAREWSVTYLDVTFHDACLSSWRGRGVMVMSAGQQETCAWWQSRTLLHGPATSSMV